MIDATIINRLFQAEFNTDIQLGEMIDFMRDRNMMKVFLPDITTEEMKTWFFDESIDFTEVFSEEGVRDHFIESEDAGLLAQEIIITKDITPEQLYQRWQLIETLTDDEIKAEYAARFDIA